MLQKKRGKAGGKLAAAVGSVVTALLGDDKGPGAITKLLTGFVEIPIAIVKVATFPIVGMASLIDRHLNKEQKALTVNESANQSLGSSRSEVPSIEGPPSDIAGATKPAPDLGGVLSKKDREGLQSALEGMEATGVNPGTQHSSPATSDQEGERGQ
ncbi:MAG: hypothetical protein HON23_04965 [Rickettsiales bacterium]|jgi:hypothetical protein|nr:hypothetical protein [Rickettsiales bacterium]